MKFVMYLLIALQKIRMELMEVKQTKIILVVIKLLLEIAIKLALNILHFVI